MRWTTWNEVRIAVIGPWRYCRGAMTSLLWPTVREVLKAAHGFICSHCIASALALPASLVTMATLGLSRLDGFEVVDGACARCGVRGRVIRSRQAPDDVLDAKATTPSFEAQPRDPPK